MRGATVIRPADNSAHFLRYHRFKLKAGRHREKGSKMVRIGVTCFGTNACGVILEAVVATGRYVTTTISHTAGMNRSIDMNVKWIRGWLSLALGILVLLSAGPVVAGEANDQLKQSVDKVLAILNDPTLKGMGNSQERRQKLKEVVYSRFDFNEMAKRALGSQWQKRSPEEQKEFVQLFTSLLEHAYLDNIESYNGEKIRFLNERQDKNFAEVNTKIINNKGQEFSLDYRLQNVNGDWKVIDVVIENISLVNNYRAQFNRLLAKSSFAELIETMKQKKLSVPGAKS